MFVSQVKFITVAQYHTFKVRYWNIIGKVNGDIGLMLVSRVT